jgi:pimeloyl-ACP methyl ester carboxylesterase
MQRTTLFAAKLLLPCWLVLLVVYPFNRIYAQEKIRIGISSTSPGFLPTVVAEQRGYIVVTPMGYRGLSQPYYGSPYKIARPTAAAPAAGWTAQENERAEQDVVYVMDLVAKEYNVDPARVYLHGQNPSGSGALYLASKYPDRFAAVVVSSAPIVYDALQHQAASGLSGVDVEGAVDRSRLIHLGYALVALVATFALYFILSSKDPLKSVGRILVPWSDVAAPSRVEIIDMKPGNTTVFRGQPLVVSAEVKGLSADEVVKVVFTTADGQVVERHDYLVDREPAEFALPALVEQADLDIPAQQDAGVAGEPRFHRFGHRPHTGDQGGT